MKILGHRGCFYETENTIKSIIKAFELGADGVEVDVQSTLDNYIVLSHDVNLKRITGFDYDIRKNSFLKLSKIDLNGEKIPLLEDVLELVKSENKIVDIEVKNPDDIKEVCNIVSRFNYDGYIISSFFHKNIFNYKKILPKINFAYLFSHEPKDIKEYIKEVDFLKPNINYLTKDYKLYSQKVIPWVVNDSKEFEYIKEFEPYGVITDFPDKLKMFLNKKEIPANFLIYYLTKSILKEESFIDKNIIKIVLKNLFLDLIIDDIKINNKVLDIGKNYPIYWKIGEKILINIENYSLDDKLIIKIKNIGFYEIEIKELIKTFN